MCHNHKTMICGIRNLLKTNYGFSGDEIDIEAEIDDTLTYQENWNKIKRKYVEKRLIMEEMVIKEKNAN